MFCWLYFMPAFM